MAPISFSTLTSIAAALFFVHSTNAYSFNTTYDTQNNGQLINPAQLLNSSGATPACLKAYVADIDCDPELFNFSFARSNAQFTTENLDKACTSTCEVALAKWIENTYAACKDQPETVITFTGMNTPAYTMLRYYRAFCTKDLNNGTYCLTEQNPAHLDIGSKYTTAQIDKACSDTCFTQNSALQWAIYSAANNTEGISTQNVADVCPKVNTHSYDVLLPVAAVASGSTVASAASSTSPPSSSGTNTAAASSNLTTTTNTAGSVSTSTTAVVSSGATTTSNPASPTAASDATSIARTALPISFFIIAYTLFV